MPRVDGPAHRELEPADPLYALAAFTYHHARRLPFPIRRGLFLALEAAWPRTQGDHKDVEHRQLAALSAYRTLVAAGSAPAAAVAAIADAFAVQPDTARRWIARADLATDHREPWDDERRTPARPDPVEPAVIVQWAEDGEEPMDPAAPLAYSRWLRRSRNELRRQRDQARRAREALARAAR